MKATAKFLFDDDFATGEKPTISVVEAERRRADAESMAYRNGFAAGQEQARSEAGERVAAALTAIADGLDHIHQALGGIEAQLETEAVEVAVAVASKLAPELVAREPMAEISALATECFRHLVSTPHIVVRIGADIYETAKGKLEEIARARGFEGRMMVACDEAMRPGDCRIEWTEGGVVRDEAKMLTMINDAVARYVAARTGAQ